MPANPGVEPNGGASTLIFTRFGSQVRGYIAGWMLPVRVMQVSTQGIPGQDEEKSFIILREGLFKSLKILKCSDRNRGEYPSSPGDVREFIGARTRFNLWRRPIWL